MSFYRALLATVVAAAIASPVFADDAAATQNATEATPAVQTSDAAATKIDLNKATAKELMKVKGLNAPKARAIVAYRKKHGEFKTMDDLMNVKGFKKMNEEKMQEISSQLSVD